MIQEFAGFHTDSDNGFDGFGFAVDMSADGNTTLVGAGNNNFNGGYIRMFKRFNSSSSYEQYVSLVGYFPLCSRAATTKITTNNNSNITQIRY